MYLFIYFQIQLPQHPSPQLQEAVRCPVAAAATVQVFINQSGKVF